ncbi:hypothetical protein CI238_09468, partial [Colletotrichum incanum]
LVATAYIYITSRPRVSALPPPTPASESSRSPPQAVQHARQDLSLAGLPGSRLRRPSKETSRLQLRRQTHHPEPPRQREWRRTPPSRRRPRPQAHRPRSRHPELYLRRDKRHRPNDPGRHRHRCPRRPVRRRASLPERRSRLPLLRRRLQRPDHQRRLGLPATLGLRRRIPLRRLHLSAFPRPRRPRPPEHCAPEADRRALLRRQGRAHLQGRRGPLQGRQAQRYKGSLVRRRRSREDGCRGLAAAGRQGRQQGRDGRLPRRHGRRRCAQVYHGRRHRQRAVRDVLLVLWSQGLSTSFRPARRSSHSLALKSEIEVIRS